MQFFRFPSFYCVYFAAISIPLSGTENYFIFRSTSNFVRSGAFDKIHRDWNCNNTKSFLCHSPEYEAYKYYVLVSDKIKIPKKFTLKNKVKTSCLSDKSGLFSLFMDDSKMENDRRIMPGYHLMFVDILF